jgi:hypothetical protein
VQGSDACTAACSAPKDCRLPDEYIASYLKGQPSAPDGGAVNCPGDDHGCGRGGVRDPLLLA